MIHIYMCIYMNNSASKWSRKLFEVESSSRRSLFECFLSQR